MQTFLMKKRIDLIPLPPQKTSEIIKQKLWKTKGNVKFNLFPVLSKFQNLLEQKDSTHFQNIL